MCALALKNRTTIRSIAKADLSDLLKMIDTNYRIHLRMTFDYLTTRFGTTYGFLAEDNVGVRGFIFIEPQHPDTALIIAAGLRDTWSIRPCLELLLPEIEWIAQTKDICNLIYMGQEKWLSNELKKQGFQIKDWIINFERLGFDNIPATSYPASIRIVHYNDLPTILELDTLVFDHLWHKTTISFKEAIATADLFIVAEMVGQLVGYAWCEIYNQHAHLTRLAIHPHYQGVGIGTQLLHQILSQAAAKGANLVTLNTQESNYRSRALYERFGFIYTGYDMPMLCKELG